MKKHVYCVDNDYWIVASSAKSAARQAYDNAGIAEVEQLPDDQELTICDEGGENPTTKTCLEWCKGGDRIIGVIPELI